jgi:elongation factor Tu
MPVEDVFSITGRGTVATGRIERGCKSTLEIPVDILGIEQINLKSVPSLVSRCSARSLNEGEAGDNATGLLARGIDKDSDQAWDGNL